MAGPSSLIKDALSLAGDVIPTPGSGVILRAIGQVIHLYQKHKKGQRDQRVEGGLAALASDSSELNEEIVDPASRMLTLMGATQPRRFAKPQVETLAECAVRLMRVYIVYELPDHPHTSYGDVIQHLLLAVRVKSLAGVKIKDINGSTLKPKQLGTLKGEILSETQILAAFEMKVVSPRPALTPASVSKPPAPPRLEEQKNRPTPGSAPVLGGAGAGSRPASPPPKHVEA